MSLQNRDSEPWKCGMCMSFDYPVLMESGMCMSFDYLCSWKVGCVLITCAHGKWDVYSKSFVLKYNTPASFPGPALIKDYCNPHACASLRDFTREAGNEWPFSFFPASSRFVHVNRPPLRVTVPRPYIGGYIPPPPLLVHDQNAGPLCWE